MRTSCCHSKLIHRTGNETICSNTACENYLAVTSCYLDYGFWKNPVAASIFVFLLMFSFDNFSMQNKEQKLNLAQVSESALTIKSLQTELLNQNILCPEHVLAQIKLESGNLTSFLLKRTNNMLGMRYPLNRKTTACGIYIPSKDTVITGSRNELKKYLKMDNYAVYSTWKDCVADYKLWQESNFNVAEQYLSLLGKIYAKDADYVQKIKQMVAQPIAQAASH